MMILRIRYRQRGDHVHARVFTGPSLEGTFASCGELTFRLEEWPAFVALLNATPQSALVEYASHQPVRVQFKHDDDVERESDG